MAGGSDGLSALKAHLLKKAYNESLLGLSDVTDYLCAEMLPKFGSETGGSHG